MTTPRIEIDLRKISHNARQLRELYASKGIGVIGVTKVVCGNPDVADALVETGIDILADSRIQNIVRMRQAGVQAQFVLLRTPALSQVESAVRYADISFNTEMSVIERLSDYSVANDTVHRIILMVEMGDLREGLMPDALERAVELVNSRQGTTLAGIGANFACLGGVEPDAENLGKLSRLAANLEKKFDMTLEHVSGGNSANHDWFVSASDVGRVNSLRLGESIFLGRETLHRKPILGLFTDAFKLFAEVIESHEKPSKPRGKICQDAFGNVPEFQDRGPIRRAILGIGRQDVLVTGLSPCIDIEILGASSDHVIVDARELDLKVGEEVELDVDYGALLAAMTSPYVDKEIVSDRALPQLPNP
jgi:predicted amino acid racemase